MKHLIPTGLFVAPFAVALGAPAMASADASLSNNSNSNNEGQSGLTPLFRRG